MWHSTSMRGRASSGGSPVSVVRSATGRRIRSTACSRRRGSSSAAFKMRLASLVVRALPGQILSMSSPIYDFSHLTPEERIQLAEELWDSLEPQQVPASAEPTQELERRVELHRKDPDRGRPAEDVLRDLEQRGR